jgi:hypothetical protein
MTRGVQESDVWEAADALLVAGQRPTIERVRQKIGRGSPNTVSPMLDTWFKDLGARLGGSGFTAAGREVPDPVGQAARHLWEVAQSLAEEETTSAMASERDVLTARERDLSERAFDLDNREHAYRAQIATLEATLHLAQQEREGFKLKCYEREASLNDREEQLLNARRLELELRDQLAAAEVTLADERRTADARHRLADERLDKSEGRAAAEIDRAREESKLLAAELRSANIALDRERSQGTIAQEHLSDTKSKLEATTLELQRSRASHQELLTELSAQKTSNQALLSALGDAQDLLRLKDQEHGALLKSLVANASAARRKQSKASLA